MPRKEESARDGQVIRTETAPDRASSHKVNFDEALNGRKMGGGPLDVSHSLTSAGEVKPGPKMSRRKC